MVVKSSKTMNSEALTAAAECLRALAHPQRLRMVQLLLSGRRLPVGALATECGLPQPQASEHLRLMQRCGFLRAEREGREVYYEISEPHLASLMACIERRFGASSGGRSGTRPAARRKQNG